MGWDFYSLAVDEGHYYPCEATLDSHATPWVGLAQSIGAPVLFGKGFGEIIKPEEPGDLCEYWSTLPKGRSYLATLASTIHSIAEKFGDPSTNPLRLTSDLIWYMPPDTSGPCKCKETPGEHSDFAQVVCPAKSPLHLTEQFHSAYPTKGAIVVGRNSLCPIPPVLVT